MSGLDILGCKYDSTNARLNDTSVATWLLLASNVAPLIAENNLTEAQFSQRFYGSTSSVRYMLRRKREIFSELLLATGSPKLTIERRIHLPDYARILNYRWCGNT